MSVGERFRGLFALVLISLLLLIPAGVMVVLHQIQRRAFDRLAVDVDKVVVRFRIQAKVIFDSQTVTRLAKPGEPGASTFSLTHTTEETPTQRSMSWLMVANRNEKGWMQGCEVRLVQRRWLGVYLSPRIAVHGMGSSDGSIKAKFDSLMTDQGLPYEWSDAFGTP